MKSIRYLEESQELTSRAMHALANMIDRVMDLRPNEYVDDQILEAQSIINSWLSLEASVKLGKFPLEEYE
jgi:hypothetical protein